MFRIQFQNGEAAPEIFLAEEYETETEAKKRLESLVHTHGTVPDAIAWLEGTDKPKFGKFAKAFASTTEGTRGDYTPSTTAPEAPEPSDVPDRLPDPPPDSEAAAAEVNATDAAKEFAEENDVDLSQVVGTGDGGRIGKPDVEKFLDTQ